MQLLDFNVGINFSSRGNLREFSPNGFSAAADESSTWTQQMTADLSFRAPPLRSDLRVTIEATPFTALRAGIVEQECWIYLNGLFVHFCKLREASEIAFNLPREQLVMRGNKLSFILPNAASPSELGIGDDVRQLGLAIARLTAKP